MGWLDNMKDGGFLGTTNKGFNYNGAWGGQFKGGGWLDSFANGGSMPGSVGFSYARTGAPSNGPHARKTLASAQDGEALPTVPQEQVTYDDGELQEVVIQQPAPSPYEKIRREQKKTVPWEQFAKERYLGNFEKGMGQTLENLPEYRKQEYEDYIDKQAFGAYTKAYPKQKGEERGAYIDRIRDLSKDSERFESSYAANARYNPSTDQNVWRKGAVGLASLVAPEGVREWQARSPYYSSEERSNIITSPNAQKFENVLGTLEPLTIPSSMLYAKNTDWAGAAQGRAADVDPATAIFGDPLNLAFEAPALIKGGISALKESSIASDLAQGVATLSGRTQEYLAPRIGQAVENLKGGITRIPGDIKSGAKNIYGLATGEANKSVEKAQQIYKDTDAMLQSPESNELLRIEDDLRNKRYDIQDKVERARGKKYNDMSAEIRTKLDAKEARQRKSQNFTINNEGLVHSTKDTSLGLRTGSSDIVDFATGEKHSISTSVPSEDVRFDLKGDKVVKSPVGAEGPHTSPEYRATLKKNIAHVEEHIPGAKVFGSAVNAAEAELPHLIGDYDVIMSQTAYDKFAKTNPKVGDNGFAAVHNLPGTKVTEPIDINVIQEVKGKATGERAQELFRQVAPDEFYEASKAAMKNKTEIKIPYSSEELVEKTNPTTKSVVDAYESTKDKHINKIDALINFGKPEVVKAGQEQYVKGLLGSKGNVGHQFEPEHFADVAANNKLLDEIGFVGNKEIIANNPGRMQLVLNDYYMNNSIIVRQVDKSDKPSKILAAIKEYHPQAGGGAVNGIGQNHVTLGFPGHGWDNVTAVKQVGLDLDKTNPAAYVESIKRQTSANHPFTTEETDMLHKIVDDLKVDIGMDPAHVKASKNTGELIERLPYSEEGKDVLYEFAKKAGKHMAKKDYTYGTGNYTSTLRDFDEAIDIMQHTTLDQVNMEKTLKSFHTRKQAAERAGNKGYGVQHIDELLPKQFKAIKAYLEEGHTRASERIRMLQEQRNSVDDEIRTLRTKFVEKKLGPEKKILDERRAAFDKQISDLYQQANALYDRKYQLDRFKDKFMKTIILGGGAAAVGGAAAISKYNPSRSGQRKVKKPLTEKEREQKLEQREPLLNRIFGIEAGSGDPNYKKEHGGIIDDNMGQWAHPGKITRISGNDITMRGVPYNVLGISDRGDKKLMKPGKDYKFKGSKVTEYPIAKDGNQLTKLNQLTNFTNYNTKQPGGWLDKL